MLVFIGESPNNMSQDLKQIIREEYIKCAQDPAHFMKKYCNIQFISFPRKGIKTLER